jgi:hypothetical protein
MPTTLYQKHERNLWILIGPLIGPFEGLHAYKNLLEHYVFTSMKTILENDSNHKF